MRFEWDEARNQRNVLKHGIRFETAILVFDDPNALTERDESSEEEERWITFRGHWPESDSCRGAFIPKQGGG
jgi:uncharacterized DUF497 family protein